jgi:hypothetical protein
LLRQLAEKGITTFALDRCPRCPIFTTTGISLKSPDPLLMVWAVHKATELARMELYVNYALNAARAGRLETAREVTLETVGHVDLENPRPHFLLGEIGLALSDRTLRQEAREFLSFLKHDRWLERLDEVVRKGRPSFDNLD